MRRWDWIWYSRTLHWRKFLKSLRRFWLDLYAVIADSDAQTLAHTIYAQPAIMATSLICLEAAKKRGFTYDAVAGHSLGEYAAMVASGMLSLEDGFRVIKARSEAMDAAAKAADGACVQS